MASSSFCDACGAALPLAAIICPVCGQDLQAPSRVYFSQTTPHPHKPPMQRYSVLMQRYRILEKIGEGGFGLVYKAIDKKNNMIVAIKQINVAALSMQEIIDATDSYNREITLLPRLQHQSLPHIYGYFTDEDHWYIIMEYINGETLEETLAKASTGRLPVQQVLNIGMALCDVLAYLHAQQPSIIYRDIKPANIMITDKGAIYLIDFGTARRYRADQSRDTGSLGSPGYAAPEQYGKAQTTPKTDIYGLGATLQTLLTGKEPLEIATGGIPLECDIPTDLQRLIRQMMSRDASKRPYDMKVVGQALADTKKRLSGLPGRFASPFTWLATLWGLFIIGMASIFLSTFSLDIWSFYFLVALCAVIGMNIHYFYKAKRIIPDKLTIKEIGIIINEGLSRPLAGICWILIFGGFYSLIPLLFRLHVMQLVTLIGFVIIGLSVMFAILKGLPWLLKWLKRKRVIRQAQQSTSIPPLQQQMH
jgi:predicted Ser/Thr protein kinase